MSESRENPRRRQGYEQPTGQSTGQQSGQQAGRTTAQQPKPNDPNAHAMHTALLRPPDRTKRQKVADFFWDPRTKMCLTRTPRNWASISIYYFFFILVVFLIFYISMLIAEAAASRNKNSPYYTLDDSLISPKLNYFPLKDSKNLIWLSDSSDYSVYVNKIRMELDNYKKINRTFNATKFAECGKAPYGFKDKQPCLFFRMNRILQWEPEPFVEGDEFPTGMPDHVKELIKNSTTPKVWFSCRGTTPKDRDHIKKDFFQFPGGPSFAIDVFPFVKQKGFVDPIIVLKLKDSKPDKVLYSFTCTAWAQNIDPEKCQVDVIYYNE